MTAKNFKEATAFINVISRLWGLRNFTRSKNKITFFFGCCYNIFVLCLSISLIVLVEFAQFTQLDYATQGVMYKYLIVLYIFTLTYIMILGSYHSQDLLAFKKLACKVEEDFQALGSTRNYRSTYRQIALFASFCFCALMVVWVQYLKWMSNKSLTYVIVTLYSYSYGFCVESIILLDFKTNVYWIGIKFKETNELLNAILLKHNRNEEEVDTICKSIKNSHDRLESDRRQFESYSPRSKIFPENYVFNSTLYQPRSTKTIFRQIRFVHRQLCCMTKLLNKTFDTQLLILSANIVMYVTIVCYYICNEIRTAGCIQLLGTNLLTIFITDAIFASVKVCIATYNCEYVMKLANETTEIIHKFALCQADTELKEEILQFSLQISHARQGKPKIYYFSLDYSFLRGCAVFVMTYLVIIIQFNKAGDLTRQDLVQNTTPITP